MTVTQSLRALDEAWGAAIEPADLLRVTLLEDNPARKTKAGSRGRIQARGDDAVPKAVSDLADCAVDIVALLEAGTDRLNTVLLDDDRGDEEPDGARSAVAFIQDRRLEMTPVVAAVSRVEKLLELRGLSQRRDRAEEAGHRWVEWWDVVLRSLNDVLRALGPIDEALADCWRALSERPHVQLGTATVGRLRVREQSPARPEGAAVPAPRARQPLRPVPVPRTGDN